MATNEPVTQWTPTDGIGEMSTPGFSFIVDTTGKFLVDTVGDNVIDTGSLFTNIPNTTWEENDGI
jgi:hypothetical protein